jgi:hypothetical protein
MSPQEWEVARCGHREAWLGAGAVLWAERLAAQVPECEQALSE